MVPNLLQNIRKKLMRQCIQCIQYIYNSVYQSTWIFSSGPVYIDPSSMPGIQYQKYGYSIRDVT